MTLKANVSDAERWASLIGGAGLALWGLTRRSRAGYLLASSGGLLIARAATGFCPAYAATGNGASHRSDTREALGGSRGVHVDATVTIHRSADDLYQSWRELENLPRVMSHLISVTETGERTSHWVARAPAGRTVEWDAEIINDVPGKVIGWRTLDNADVVSAGSVVFHENGKGETSLRVKLQYDPPGGGLGSAVAWLMAQEPSQTISEDLRRFKALMETGEVPTTAGQPRGKQSPFNYD